MYHLYVCVYYKDTKFISSVSLQRLVAVRHLFQHAYKNKNVFIHTAVIFMYCVSAGKQQLSCSQLTVSFFITKYEHASSDQCQSKLAINLKQQRFTYISYWQRALDIKVSQAFSLALYQRRTQLFQFGSVSLFSFQMLADSGDDDSVLSWSDGAEQDCTPLSGDLPTLGFRVNDVMGAYNIMEGKGVGVLCFCFVFNAT